MMLLPLGGAAPASAPATGELGSSNCTRWCGNISIPYPSGIEPGCYHHGFNLTCNRSYLGMRMGRPGPGFGLGPYGPKANFRGPRVDPI
nr:unnamed protein product [Digitaria exilis]CAB3483395.1 unnamed protein product [Digitaria exilis]